MFFALSCALGMLLGGHLLRRAAPWLVGLRDRRLPFGWPWLEFTSALIFFLLGREFAGDPRFWPAALLSALLLAACATDYLVKLIPDRITLGGSIVGIALSALLPELILSQPFSDVLLGFWGLPAGAVGAALLAFVGALSGFALLELVRRVAGLFAGIEAMGMGDSKLLMLIGAFLGPYAAAATLALSFLLGVVHGLAAALITRQPHAPFGPALAAGAWVYLLAGAQVMLGWEAFQALVLSLPMGWLIVAYTVMLTGVVLLVLRMRRRAAEYEEIIEADYRAIDARLGEGAPEDPER